MRKIFLLLVLLPTSVFATELIHQFKNPSFNGIGYSSHVLTIETIEKNRSDAIEASRKAKIAEMEAQMLNTPLNRFMNLFQSQVYAQLSTQLSNNLFQNKCKNSDGSLIEGCTNPNTGNFVLDGNTVTWNKSDTSVMLTVVDTNGTMTTVTVPIASFGF